MKKHRSIRGMEGKPGFSRLMRRWISENRWKYRRFLLSWHVSQPCSGHVTAEQAIGRLKAAIFAEELGPSYSIPAKSLVTKA